MKLPKPQVNRLARATSVNDETLMDRWRAARTIETVLLDSHGLEEFTIIRCANTGKPLGTRSAQYLAELRRIHGLERAADNLMLDAIAHRQRFTCWYEIGETHQRLMWNDPVTFFMMAVSDYFGWNVPPDADFAAAARARYEVVKQKARTWDNLTDGLKQGVLTMRSLLTACELLRRYLGIAGKHRVSDAAQLAYISSLSVPATTEWMETASEYFSNVLRETLLAVAKKRREVRSRTNLIAEARAALGGIGQYHAMSRMDAGYSADEHARVILETLGNIFTPESELPAFSAHNMRLMREKSRRMEREEKRLFSGTRHTMKASDALAQVRQFTFTPV